MVFTVHEDGERKFFGDGFTVIFGGNLQPKQWAGGCRYVSIMELFRF